MLENTPAAEAGIREGDIVVQVDGRDARELSLDELRALFVQDGSTRTLLLRRGDETRTATLRLRRLV